MQQRKSKTVWAGVAAWAMVVAAVVFSPASAAAAQTPDAAQQAPRIVFDDDFSSNDGSGWAATKANDATTISFSGGMATITGGGPENRIVSAEDVLAQNFTLTSDLFINAGNTNAAVKIGFFSNASAADRHQVTWDGPHKLLKLERVVNGTTTTLETASGVDLPVNTGGEAHEVAINVDGDRVTVAVNGQQHLDVADAGTAAARQGRLVFAGQFPAQDFSVDRVTVTTTEEEVVGEYTVDVETMTNGVLDTDPATAGGTLRANRTSGNEGDVVTLSYSVEPGFVFDGYESLRKDTGTSTDGLLTITDDQFAFNDKTGSVVIIAKFIDEPEDPNVVFADYFRDELNSHGLYTFSNENVFAVVDGALHIAPDAGAAHAFVDSTTWNEATNYRIAFDAYKVNATAGTAQIAFRGDSFDDRYVLALNGSKALLRRMDSNGSNVELASALYTFNQTSRNIVIDVSDDTVSVSSDGVPVLSYDNRDDGDRDTANWSGLTAGLGLINMTPGAPVAFDNVIVTRIPEYFDANVTITADGEADEERASGAVVLAQHRVAAGEQLGWTTYPKGGYEFDGMYFEGTRIDGPAFTVPESIDGPITLVANFVATPTSATSYYIDSNDGDDANSGTSRDQAWATLTNLDRTFEPGDKILLKRGSVFEGAAAALRFQGSGSTGAPITVAAYGEGARPQLNGAGEVDNVISLFNQEHITISDLEITNLHPSFNDSFELNASSNREKDLRAVNVSARDFGVVRGIRISDLYIHDVNGNLAVKWNGGIFFDVQGSVVEGEIRGVPTKYDDVVIEGNVLERVDRSGIKLVSSAWANQSLQNNPGQPLHWYPSTNVVVRDNQFRYMGGDAITVRDTDGALIEYNLARHSRYQNTGYNAGIWPFQATNTVIQYNEVSHTHGVQDGQGLDTDHVSAYSVMQYNYSHNNEGGFMLIMNGFPHTAPTIRYNISQNDADKTFEFARGTAAGTMIYNNTISSDMLLQGPRGGVLDLANSAAGTGNREIFIFNNVFNYPEGQRFYVGEADTMKTKAKLFNNAYTGGIAVPDEEEQAITGDTVLPGLGTAPDNAEATQPLAGIHAGNAFDGYIPEEESILRNVGVSVAEVVEHFGGTLTDRRHMTPTEIHALALEGESIDFAAGGYLPAVDGVLYNLDFLGNPLPGSPDAAEDTAALVGITDTDEGLTIGAVQYTEAEPEPEPSPEPEPTDEPTPTPTDEPKPSPEPTDEPTVAPTPAPSPDGNDDGSDAGDAPDGELPMTGSTWPTTLAGLALLLIGAGWWLRRRTRSAV
ncbi:right-handed parallel beta-helix repeat-containing protein [Microbacterium sp. YY-01]|uniref:right-handed parallel beta-helix repeat-containing protein n=1 Tax=Microbacterium sp. YY-01 TaxID=3421634 RepID=UPI003D162BC6